MVENNVMFGPGGLNDAFGDSSGGTAGNSITIEPSDDMQIAYDYLKSSDRDAEMGALSATNWRTLLLAPGTYPATTKTTFDTDYVACAAISSDKTATIIYGGINEDCLLEQTCDTLALAGFTVLVEDTYVALEDPMGGFWLNGCENSQSQYFNMAFNQEKTIGNIDGEVNIYPCNSVNSTDFKGTWIQCSSNWQGFRATGDVDTGPIDFDPVMIDCHAITTTNSGSPPPGFLPFMVGARKCFGGDGVGPLENGTPSVGDTGLVMKGTYYNCSGGDQSFAGCSLWTSPIHTDAKFFNCHAGRNSFCLDEDCAGYFENCSAEGNSFGGQGGTFAGEAVNCQVGDGLSLVSSIKGGFGSGTGGCSGILRNCKIVEMNDALTITGAYIDGLWAKTTETDGDAIILAANGSAVYNSTIIANGTGEAITGAFSVAAAHNRTNTAFADGSSTNTITTPYNVEQNTVI